MNRSTHIDLQYANFRIRDAKDLIKNWQDTCNCTEEEFKAMWPEYTYAESKARARARLGAWKRALKKWTNVRKEVVEFRGKSINAERKTKGISSKSELIKRLPVGKEQFILEENRFIREKKFLKE